MSTQYDAARDGIPDYASFGPFLRFLRRRARLTQRELGIAVGYSEAHISLLESGRRLPDLTTVAALFVPALGLQDEPELVARLLQQAAAARHSASVTVTRTVRRQVISAEEIVDEVLHANPPAMRSSPHAPRSPLPAPLLPLLGRESAVVALRGRLLDPAVRLLTLVGPPGVGKTRLALELAWDLDGAFPDGARFVELAALSDPAALPGTLIQVLALPPPAGTQSERECLHAGLRDRRLLLVLDNFEQLHAAATQVADMLTAAPGLKILVTSRVALDLYGEYEWLLPPLAMPELAPLPPLDELADNPSVALFVARAQAVQPDFALSEANALPVAATCVRLDGLPLALELAAAQCKRFQPVELAANLVRDRHGAVALRLLARASQNVDARHHTLHDAIDWSFKLLAAEEQALFARLGVFAGGFTSTAAESVCSVEGSGLKDAIVHPSAVHRLLGGLTEKNLVRLYADAEPRYILLETLRAFALERLSARGELESTQRRHAEYFARWLESADAPFDPPGNVQWAVCVRAEQANLRTALAWCEGNDAELGLRLASRLWVFWNAAGQFGEGRAWLEALLARADLPSGARALALLGLGVLRARQWQYTEARSLLLESLALYQQLGDELGVAYATGWLGSVGAYERRYDEARVLAEDALARFHTLGHKRGESWALGSLAGNAKDRGDYEGAQRLFEAHLRLAREDGFTRHIGWQLATGANFARLRYDHARAREMLDEALVHFTAVDDRPGIAYTLGLLGYQSRLEGDWTRAASELARALEHANESRQYVPVTLCYLGIVAIAQGDHARGTRLCAHAFALRPNLRLALDVDETADLDASLATARAALGETLFDKEWRRGSERPEHEVMATAPDISPVAG